MRGTVLVEGLPGSGKSTTAHDIAAWLVDEGVEVEHWPEGATDHPVDFEQVAVLRADDLAAIASQWPDAAPVLHQVAEPSGDVWLVRSQHHPALPAELVERLRRHDAYDGDVPPELHSAVLVDSWRRHGASVTGTGVGAGRRAEAVQVWECVLLQNPVCALVARADQPLEVLERHVTELVGAVRSHAPALVYLDTGDPRPFLERAAAERPAEWLDVVVGYHTERGLGLRRGLVGFDGYVEFMRLRREMELEVVQALSDAGLPVLMVAVDPSRREASRRAEQAAVRAFLADHLGLVRGMPRAGRPDTLPVA